MSIQDRKTREFERRGQEILTAALALFQSDDWEGVTVEQIAQKAEVAKGTIYKHFASKDEMYARLAIEFQRRTFLAQSQIDPDLPVLERFRLHMQSAWEMHLSSKELHRVFMYCSRGEFRSRLPQSLVDELSEVEMAVNRPIHTMLEQGMNEGLFPRKPTDQLLFGATAAFWGAIQLVWSGYLGEIDRHLYLAELTQFILAGLIYQDRRLGTLSPTLGTVA